MDNNIRAIEKDMISLSFSEEDTFSEKVFKFYPLIGDYDMSDDAFRKMYTTAKEVIDTSLATKDKKYQKWVHEQITLLVVHLAKQWNSNEESKFSRYVALNFGYRDDTGKVWNLITQSLDIAFNKNGKYFIRRNGERQFYDTVMAHSFGPAKAWYPLFDLLFSFYMDNLEWNYVPNDPLFSHLVNVLQKKLNKDTLKEEEYLIASKTYSFRVGLRRLIQDRPGYCSKLFEDIIKRMHFLLLNKTNDNRRYIIRLVDQWFAEKLSDTKEISQHATSRRQNETVEVALDYSTISPRYVLSGEKLLLKIPSIRIISDYFGDASVRIFAGTEEIQTIPLEIHGNELGETIAQTKIEVKREAFFDNDIQIRIVIYLGEEIIYDSGKKLWRHVIAFSDGKEILLNKLRKESYLFFCLDPSYLSGDNVGIQDYGNTGVCRVDLHKDYCLKYRGNIIAVDTIDIKDVRIVPPVCRSGLVLKYNEQDYSAVSGDSSLKVYFSKETDMVKYRVCVGEESVPLLNYYDRNAGNRAVIPLCFSEEGLSSISLNNIETGKTVFSEGFFDADTLSYAFNKKIFFPNDGEEQQYVTVKDNSEEKVIWISAEQETVNFEYGNGMVEITVPRLSCRFENVHNIHLGKYVRIEDINSSSFLCFENTSGLSYFVEVGTEKYSNPKQISLGFLSSKDKQIYEESVDIIVSVAGYERTVATIVLSDMFFDLPKLFFKDDTLYWDGGISFIGDKKTKLELDLKEKGEQRYIFDLSFEENRVVSFANKAFHDAVYSWEIRNKHTGKLYAASETFIGNTSRARFANKTITIKYVTEDIEDSSSVIEIKPVYIEQIEYLGAKYVYSEDEVFDVYNGNMFWEDYYYEKRYYSFKYNEEKGRYRVNPVKIIYINDNYLRIVNQDDDGIYCFYNERSRNPGYEITDREPKKGAQNYKDILFCVYETNKEKAAEKSDLVNTQKQIDGIKGDQIDNKRVATITSKLAGSNKETSSKETNAYMLSNISNVPQSDIIEAPVNARILVNAGPGTGKTWTLIEKIIYMVQNQGVDPESIQVLCFSRAAVEVVRNRMGAAIREGTADISVNYVDIRTFDSFASQLLYWLKDSDYDVFDSHFKIEELNYEERIILFTKVICDHNELLSQCEHLIVDEVQDLVLSRAAMVLEIINAIPEKSGVTLFGDACQSIYDYQVDDEGMSSEQFYNRIIDRGDFELCSFDKNFRQNTYLQSFSEEYRKAILSGDIDTCKNLALKLSEEIPYYDEFNIRFYEEGSLDRLLSMGDVGILTRSNVQALVIGNYFRHKGIPHIVKRRLEENYLNSWIALLFNSKIEPSYNKEDFSKAFREINNSANYSNNDIDSIWNSISEGAKHQTGRISSRDLLVGIKNYSKNKLLFVEEKKAPVVVSTIHRSKGKEYSSVIILNGLLSNTSNELEEQRVNYVAITRAKDHIFKSFLENIFFKSLENRRCYSGAFSKAGKLYLDRIEIGMEGDLYEPSFAFFPGVQEYVRDNYESLINQEVYLERIPQIADNGLISYAMKLRSNGMVLAITGWEFYHDLQKAIRDLKGLPQHADIYDYLYPVSFYDLYISDIASAIGTVKGNEKNVIEYGDIISWNTLLIQGYAKAEY